MENQIFPFGNEETGATSEEGVALFAYGEKAEKIYVFPIWTGM